MVALHTSVPCVVFAAVFALRKSGRLAQLLAEERKATQPSATQPSATQLSATQPSASKPVAQCPLGESSSSTHVSPTGLPKFDILSAIRLRGGVILAGEPTQAPTVAVAVEGAAGAPAGGGAAAAGGGGAAADPR